MCSEDMGWSSNSSVDVGREVKLVKCSQALSNWLKKYSLFCFCKFSCVLDLRICFCPKRVRPSLEFRIKFSQHIDHYRDLITFESILFLEILISCLCLKYLVHPSKWTVELGGRIFSVPEEIYILSISFLIYFGIVYIWLRYKCLDKRICFTIIFLTLKESPTLFKIWIFLLYIYLFCSNWSYRG